MICKVTTAYVLVADMGRLIPVLCSPSQKWNRQDRSYEFPHSKYNRPGNTLLLCRVTFPFLLTNQNSNKKGNRYRFGTRYSWGQGTRRNFGGLANEQFFFRFNARS